MKFISWNVNGIRACLKKGFQDYFDEMDADFFSIQETKCQAGQVDLEIPGYYQFWNYAERKGYSGTAIFTKHEPISVKYGVGDCDTQEEGRIITLEYETFYLVNVYTPNSKRDLTRLEYRVVWEDELRAYLKSLDKVKPVIYCGDLNVAHEEIDLKNPKANIGNSGFTDEERGRMTRLLNSGFTDSFRYLYPDVTDRYTWWSYMNKVRERNIGWRIDYFIVSNRLQEKIINAEIHDNVLGSDHCPIMLEIK
ncbi:MULTISPECIES: exodeoxyribonuclease III [unclassified Rummeliibacillus]|uniref:exodeoxyribonuclease III n=1 Tax=unclassified Rummeliibacillus TaxID=2622809 RepID=UPI000E66EBA7|nr:MULTISPECIES: exodeoxyribonuclease III [unclassified Rummeliibacillus]RIJ64392.1 exodeoxyribonuclease III [Rummeliibacillus sp. POC4]RPJ96556.1 exodeoxyribonuclease III [Rummeliibacillus sp. TYF005]